MPFLHDSILSEDDSTTSELHRAQEKNFGSFHLEFGKKYKNLQCGQLLTQHKDEMFQLISIVKQAR